MGTLSGRHALVTGGASGIGAAIARRLVAEGATVVIADISVEAGSTMAHELGATFARLDVGDPEQWDRVIATNDLFDIGVLNAGITTRSDRAAEPASIPLADLTDDDYRRALAVNLDGVVFGARALIPGMCARQGGDLVVTASLAGLVGMPMDPVYGLTKHAVVGLVRSLAPALEPFGVCISSLNPGFVDTPILGPSGRERLAELGVPVMPPARIADVVLHALDERVPGAQWIVWGDDPIRSYTWNPAL
jgi:NAD(P)-dependent dehydrogenase (short-subunit alcohol dehydrogenase family)